MADSAKVMASVHAIGATAGSNDKVKALAAAIKEHGDPLRDLLVRTYSPFVTYGIKQLPYVDKHGDGGFDAGTMGMLDDLASRKLTGGNAQQAVAGELARLDMPSAELLSLVISGDLGAGIAATSINKVAPGLIPVSPYMRCSLMDKGKLASWPWAEGVYSQIKADGMFVNVNRDDDNTWLTSRSGQRLPSTAFVDLLKQCARTFYSGTQTHGELLVVGPDGKDLPRKVGNGMINSVAQGGEWPEGHKPRLSVWDQIYLRDAVQKGRDDTHYKARFSRLIAQVGLADRTRPLTCVGIIESKLVRSLREAFAHCRDALARGLEGTIIKHPELCWRDTGSGAENLQVKLKVEAPCEVRVRAMVAGKKTGKNAELFGSLQCTSECGEVDVNIPGFTDKMRKHIFDNWATIKDSVIAIVFNDILYSESKKTYSLFLPRFNELRPDKTVADTKERIEAQFKAAMLVDDEVQAVAKAAASPRAAKLIRRTRPVAS